MQTDIVELSGIQISHPEKVLYPEHGITKRMLADYYTRIAPLMIPELKNRPLSLVRCPTGRSKKCFFQKHLDFSKPSQVATISVEEGANTEEYAVIRSVKDLIYLVQLNVLEIHCWGSRFKRVNSPDRMVFDLDPDPEIKPGALINAARLLKDLLEGIGLKSFLRTTGGKGLHLVVPIAPKYEWGEVQSFSRSVADALEAEAPDQFTARSSKSKRKGKIFVDYLRNGFGATSIANYSTRASPGAPIATPLRWDELTPRLKPNEFTLKTIFQRVTNRMRDPWANMSELRQVLPRSF